jgi:signal transduction histidine kinase
LARLLSNEAGNRPLAEKPSMMEGAILGDRRNQGQSIQPVPYHQACGGEGTRLSLSISHDIIVKHHGGSIEVDRQPGEFTEFRIVLPGVSQPTAP